MKKKIVGALISLLAVAMVTTSLAGTAIAGKGQTKQDFVFRIDGASIEGTWDKIVESGPPDSLICIHVKGQEYAGVFSIEIGTGGAVETIPNACIEYDCELQYNFWPEEMKATGVVVREVISIYSSEIHDENTFRGTLELLAKGQGQSSFVGFGTDEFEGIKIQGFTEAIIPNMVMNRIGTVMGWPTA
jgi:hypothetical protein